MFSALDIYRDGAAHDDVSLGNPDDFVDEGDRWVRILTLTVRSRTTANDALLNSVSTMAAPRATRTPAMATTCTSTPSNLCHMIFAFDLEISQLLHHQIICMKKIFMLSVSCSMYYL